MFRSWLIFALVLAASPAYAVSLTGYYKLDDATLASAAATVGTPGSYVGGFLVGDLQQAGSPGDPTGKSVRFQTTGSLDRRISIPARGGTNGNNMTISMWVQFDAAALTRDVALANNDTTFGASNVNIFRDAVNSNSAGNTNAIAALLGGDPRANSATGSANNTNWHLLSFSYNTTTTNDTTQIFIDGVRSSFATANNTNGVSNLAIALGNLSGTAAHANQMGGLMDEVGFWSRALNASEQRALFFLNTNSQNNIDAAGAATLLDFFEDNVPGATTTVDGTNFLFVSDVTAFGGTAGLSQLVGSQMVLGLNPSGTSGLISVAAAAVPEPASLGLWTLLGAAAMVVAYRRLRKR